MEIGVHGRLAGGLGGVLAGVVLLAVSTGGAAAQSSTMLARYFGFSEPRIVVVDDGAGPGIAADMDGDGQRDLVIVNNRKSRIEIYRQRERMRTDDELERDFKVNELPPNPWFDRTEVSVGHRVTAVKAHDVDGDGRLDLIYAGHPSEIVVMRQESELSFVEYAKRRVRDLSAGQVGFEIGDVRGDSRMEIIALVDGRINIWSLGARGPMGEPSELGTGGDIVAIFLEDYNGDGMQDILAAVPDDPSPLRMWVQDRVGSGAKDGVLGPEIRFEMPRIREAQPVRFPDRAAASIAVIESSSRRMVMYDLAVEDVEAVGADGGMEREAVAEVFGFVGGASKDRAVAIGDLNNDGYEDLVTTDPEGNGVVVRLQESGVGLGAAESFGTFKEPKSVALGQWDDDPELEIFVLSEEEETIGVSEFDPGSGRVGFPVPVKIETSGASPVAMSYLGVSGSPAIAVIVKHKRDHTLEIHRAGGGEVVVIELDAVKRPPSSTLAGDFDHDNMLDLILFTPGEPMVLVRSVGEDAESIEVVTEKTMPNFGLVKAASATNTAMMDVDGDGYAELLIADENFVRACAFDSERGWRVIEQVNANDSGAGFVGVATIDLADGQAIVAADSANRRLVIISKDEEGVWEPADRLRLSGFDLGALRAGSFTGDSEPSVVCLADDSFALVRFAGRRLGLEEFAAWRSDEEDRMEHEIEVGDVNGDGYVDLIVLDAGEQMCQIFTFSASRKLHFANEFEVFESRLFSGGQSREFEPSSAIITDVTGDGADDIVLEVHDRFIVYPQMTSPE